ncbi:retrovirus-related pol polyprotein from transposon TNT 1-94 [Tanacetum coccineum]
MSQDVLLTVMNSMSLIGETVNMNENRKESCNLEAELLKSQNAFNDLLKSHSQLEKHCISLECSIQLNQEIFQKRESCDNQNALEILEFFENNDLKAQLQDKDSTICKLKDIIKSMREKSKEENVNYDYCEIETKNVELENSVAKLLLENERLCNEINHVKQVFKEQFDSIKKTRVRSKEQSDSLIDKLNLKSAENEDLKAQIQDKGAVFRVTSLKNDLRKLKGKEIVDIAAQIPSANTIVPGMFKLDLEPLAPRLLQNREIHIEYLKYTQEQADILWGIVEQAKAKQPLDKELDFALQKRLLSHLKTRSRTLGLKCSTSKCGSKPTGNKRNDKISQTPSRNMKNKVEAQPRKVNKKNCVDKPVHDGDVKHSLLNANSEPVCATCHVFTEVGLKWKPTGRTFNIVGNSCPLTRITSANIVPPKQTTSHSVETQKSELKVYSRKPKNVKNIGSSKKVKIVESKTANHSEPNPTWGSNAKDIPSSSSLVMTCCPDCSLVQLDSGMTILQESWGIVTISWDILLFQEGVDLLSGSRDTNLYTISLDDMLKTSLICLLSKASKTKSWKKQETLPSTQAEDTNQEKLYLLHMDLCGPMRVASINGKRHFVNFMKMLASRIKHLLPALLNRTALSKEAINTACYTQNRSLIRRQYNKTPYELMQDKKPDLSFFHVFGALCYPTNDNEDLGKLDAKADIGIFVGYAPAKKAFRIYNKRTHKIIETIHVTFDELTAMASEQFSSGPELQCMTPATSSSGLVSNPVS